MLKLNSKKHKNYASITDTGCIRKINEDSLYCSDSLWIIADGMGGHACGDIASQIAITTIVDEFSKSKNITKSIESAHNKIIETGWNNPDQKNMGTTLVAVYCDGVEVEIAWVGDSRAYLWQEETSNLELLTTDHSFVEEWVQKGIITRLQAKNHPDRNKLTRCLGAQGRSKLKIDILRTRWQKKQLILLCSDGLSDEINEKIIAKFLEKGKNNEHRLELMVDAAKVAGGRDNISAILIGSPACLEDRFDEVTL